MAPGISDMGEGVGGVGATTAATAHLPGCRRVLTDAPPAHWAARRLSDASAVGQLAVFALPSLGEGKGGVGRRVVRAGALAREEGGGVTPTR